jgi:NifU-like protein involved in Fe-S cluster formation
MNYSSLTLHYFETAECVGVLTGPGTHRGAAGSRAQGTWVQFDMQVSSGIIRAVRFLVFGCPHTIAVAAWLAETTLEQQVRAALPATVQELSDRFEVPVAKRGRLLIIEDAWVAAAAGAALISRP